MQLIYQENREYSSGNSRYQNLKVISDGSNSYLETQNQKYIKDGDLDSYHIVTEREVNRLDIIANDYYGDPSFYWVIALANNMIDPFTISRDQVLRIPSRASLSLSKIV